ncbi:hypothetical protein [Actinomadura rudentiformis]|uniref:Uncharacterized protein n=1 Tax=Actinomadura rudentiformis TaxID=359158 RepID=A0A6H9Z109_9ACTN|nr:hypothetical protein [Actinomadura rudentiformis]KAB2351455.1 hypothetical protein F8566_04200 [Actinomadura rudentiformis]
MAENDQNPDDDAPTGPLPIIEAGGTVERGASEAVRRQDLITAAVMGAFIIMLVGMLVATLWP